LFGDWRAGDLRARDRLFEIFYPELQSAAAAMLRTEAMVSLAPADLLHETVPRLIRLNRIDWADRPHFMALASRLMRRALIDHARKRRAGKRAHHRVELTTKLPEDPRLDHEELNAALERLAAVDPVHADIVEMRYYGGLSLADIALVLGISESTAKRRWGAARLWLFQALDEPE